MMKLKMKLVMMAFGLGFGLGCGTVSAEQAPEKLTWKNFDEVADYARQSEREKLYLEVNWHNSVLDAQRVAFAADKPLLLWLYFGDPRGNC